MAPSQHHCAEFDAVEYQSRQVWLSQTHHDQVVVEAGVVMEWLSQTLSNWLRCGQVDFDAAGSVLQYDQAKFGALQFTLKCRLQCHQNGSGACMSTAWLI